MLNNPLRLLTLAILCLVLTACASQRVVDHPRFADPRTRSVLVLPPANETTAAQAGELYVTTLAVPLSRAGFYVLPTQVTRDIMRNDGIIDGAQLDDVAPQRFYELFGADMLLRTRITEWNTTYVVIGGSVSVAVEFELISTHTGEVLWNTRERRVANTSGGSSNLLGLVLETALNTAQQDYMPLARELSQSAFSALPYGPYHLRYVPREEMEARMEEARQEQLHQR